MKTILVTGGGRGIGRAIAVAFAEPGYRVAIAARTRAQLEETAQAVAGRGAEPVLLPIDVTNEDAVAAGFAELRTVADRLDVLVNSARIGGGPPLPKTATAGWRRLLRTTISGT